MLKEAAQGQLLTTKIYVPSLRPDIIARQRLIERLNEGLSQQLILLCAPAGFGKTTLLSEWLAQLEQNVECAWVSLDKDDDDPLQFWHYIVAALEHIYPDLQKTVPLPTSAQTPTLLAFVTTLLNMISTTATSKNIVLVLDDYHLIHNPIVHETMLFFLEHLLPTLHLVLATREEPPFPLARLRGKKQLTELRATDLRFTSMEATNFLHTTFGMHLSAHEIETLEQKTEGWITGLQLAALSLRGRQDVAVFIDSFHGNHRHIMDYLMEEVLARLPEPVQTFLLSTCILDCLTAPLCDALTQRNDAQATLEYLEQANVFILPLDDVRQWYRYHHLFSEAMLHRLQQTQPDTLLALHRNASVWYEHNGFTTLAVEHALVGNDIDFAVAMVRQQAPYLMSHGETHILLRLLEQLPYERVCSSVKLHLYYMWVLLSAGRWDDVERNLNMLKQDLTEVERLEANGEHILSDVISIRGALEASRGNSTQAIELTQQALERVPGTDYTRRSYILLHLVMAHWMAGDLVRAEQVLSQAHEASQWVGYSYITFNCMHLHALFQIMRGHLHQAYALYRQALQLCLAEKQASMSMLYLGLATVLYERNDMHEAMYHMTTSIELGQAMEDYRLLTFSYLGLARVKLSQGDAAGAREMLHAGEHAMQHYTYGQAVAQQLVARIELYVALGDLEEATRLARDCHASVDDMPAQVYTYEHHILAKLLLMQGKTDEALPLVQYQLEAAKRDGRTGSEIKFLILSALVLQKKSQTSQALDALAHALALAEPEHFVRTFVDEGKPIAELLLALRTEQYRKSSYLFSRAYIDMLLNVLGIGSTDVPSTSAVQHAQLSEPLSERELEILRLIASGMSNGEITERLVIAMSTLKTHINHLYAKLHVRSRTQAIVQARVMQLL